MIRSNQIAYVFGLASLSLSLCGGAAADQKLPIALGDTAFSQAGTVGTMVIHRVGTDERWVVNPERADQDYAPSSTFKIPNTLIGLATGAITGMDQVMPYSGAPFLVDGKPFLPEICNGEISVDVALLNSCIPVYQTIAESVGTSHYDKWLAAFDYGSGVVDSENLHTFWLTGGVKISAQEQLVFLDTMVSGKLPVEPQHVSAVMQTLSSEIAPGVTLFGKTGYVFTSDPEIGWFVGWLDASGDIYTFALNLDMTAASHPAARKQIALDILHQIGAY